MTDNTIVSFPQPEGIDDPLTTILREGARRLLAEAVEAEAEAFLSAMREERLSDGRSSFVRHGHGPERTIQTGIGAVAVRRAKIRDRGIDDAVGSVGELWAVMALWRSATHVALCCRHGRKPQIRL